MKLSAILGTQETEMNKEVKTVDPIMEAYNAEIKEINEIMENEITFLESINLATDTAINTADLFESVIQDHNKKFSGVLMEAEEDAETKKESMVAKIKAWCIKIWNIVVNGLAGAYNAVKSYMTAVGRSHKKMVKKSKDLATKTLEIEKSLVGNSDAEYVKKAKEELDKIAKVVESMGSEEAVKMISGLAKELGDELITLGFEGKVAINESEEDPSVIEMAKIINQTDANVADKIEPAVAGEKDGKVPEPEVIDTVTPTPTISLDGDEVKELKTADVKVNENATCADALQEALVDDEKWYKDLMAEVEKDASKHATTKKILDNLKNADLAYSLHLVNVRDLLKNFIATGKKKIAEIKSAKDLTEADKNEANKYATRIKERKENVKALIKSFTAVMANKDFYALKADLKIVSPEKAEAKEDNE